MNSVIEISNPKENYLNDFEIFSELYRNNFKQLRKHAIEAFDRIGFPAIKNEDWKYTNISPVLQNNYRFASPSLPLNLSGDVYKSFDLPENAITIVFENSRWNQKISSAKNLPAGLVIETIENSVEHEIIKKHYSKYVDFNKHAFAALNTAFMLDGAFIYVHPGAIIDQPVYIININTNHDEAVVSHCRNLIVADKNSQAKIGFITLSQNDSSLNFVNAVNEIVVFDNANLEFNFIQNDNSSTNQISNTYVYQQRDSRFSITTVTLGGNLVRNDLGITLDGENIETHLNGLFIGKGIQHIDNHTSVYHAKPHCNSNELYKGIIDDNSKCVFNGKIFVMKDAQKTNAYQSNKNILLSDNATMYAKPQLEIYADDVKCSHGATTGQLDDEALFYLRSRGIPKIDAQAILNFAFANDVFNNITMESLKTFCIEILKSKIKS